MFNRGAHLCTMTPPARTWNKTSPALNSLRVPSVVFTNLRSYSVVKNGRVQHRIMHKFLHLIRC